MALSPAARPLGSDRVPRTLFVAGFSLLATALLFDLVDLWTGTGALALIAYWLAAAGLAGGLAAGLCGLARLFRTEALRSPWQLTALPGFFRAVAVALCAAGWSLRTFEGDLPAAGLAMALVGVGFAVLARWLPAMPFKPGGVAAAHQSVLRGSAARTDEESGTEPQETPRAR